MASSVRKVAANACDEHSVFVPDVKNGDVQAADYVLDRLGIQTTGNWMTATTTNAPVWGQAQTQENTVRLDKVSTDDSIMPNVKGMGARDAVYLLEKMGVNVELNGTGDVQIQSIPAGTILQGRMTCRLVLG